MMRRRRYLELVWYKALAELNVEISRAYIGFLWWVIEPVLYMAAFYLGFGLGVRAGGIGMVLFLLCALVPWKWFQSSVQSGSGTLQANSGLILQVYLPKFILPFIVVIANALKFLIVLLLLLLFLMLMGHEPGLQWLALPAVILVELMLIVAVASLAAALIPLLPDLKLIIDNGLMLLMFLSGIFFDTRRLPPVLSEVLRINPMVLVIESFRDVLLHHLWPDWAGLAWVIIVSLVVYAIAFRILRIYDRQYAKLMIN